MISEIGFWVLFLVIILLITAWQIKSYRKNSNTHLNASNERAKEHAQRMETNLALMERQTAAMERIAAALEAKNVK